MPRRGSVGPGRLLEVGSIQPWALWLDPTAQVNRTPSRLVTMARDGGPASSRPSTFPLVKRAFASMCVCFGKSLVGRLGHKDRGIDEPCRGDRSARCRLSLIVGRNRGDLMPSAPG